MKIVTNTKKIERNKKIGSFSTIASLAVLGLGLYLSFQPAYVNYSFIALILGFILSQVGIYFGARWGRSPRPDEVITQSLKGLSDNYTLYNYATPVPHLLVGPAGMWNLVPFFQTGEITYDEKKGRYKQTGANWYLRVFGQEGIGKPDAEAAHYLKEIDKYIGSHMPEASFKPQVDNALVFTNPKAHVIAEGAPYPTMHADKLKEFIRKRVKDRNWSDQKIAQVNDLFQKE